MTSVATFPAPSPFERVVDVRVFPHGFTTLQTNGAAGPAGSAVVRPNLESATWHAAAAEKWGGNIVWTGSTPRHTVAYNGPRGRYFGTLSAGTFVAMKTWFSYNGAKVVGPGGRVLGACVKTYADLPTHQTYAGTGSGTLEMQSPSTAAGALTGDYEVRCITAGPTPRFLVTGPDGQPIGVAEAGPYTGGPVLFDSLLRFELQSGALAFAVGDAWIIAVDEPEQFVVIVTPSIGGTTPLTETVWRRGVSLSPAGPWRQIASLAPVTGQVGSSVQPWFFNASATRAVTVRGLGADASGYTNGVAARSLNLDTRAVTDTVETSTPLTYTQIRVVNAVAPPESVNAGDAQDVTITNATHSTMPVAQLMALDYDGDAKVRVEIEVSASTGGSSHMFVVDDPGWFGSGDFNDNQYDIDLSASYTAQADIVWLVGGAEVRRHVAFSLAASGSYNHTWFSAPQPRDATRAESFVHNPVCDLADARAARLASTHYAGNVSTTLDPTTQNGEGQQSAGGVQLQHLVGGAIVAEVSGGSGPHAANFGSPLSEWARLPIWPGYDGEPGPPVSVIMMGVRALSARWEVSGAAVTANILPAANTSTGRGMQTSAQDTRGNWLMAAEIAAFGTTDMRWPGQISASGTYTLQAGGPDALTAAQVATLTGYAPHDRWDIGAF